MSWENCYWILRSKMEVGKASWPTGLVYHYVRLNSYTISLFSLSFVYKYIYKIKSPQRHSNVKLKSSFVYLIERAYLMEQLLIRSILVFDNKYLENIIDFNLCT